MIEFWECLNPISRGVAVVAGLCILGQPLTLVVFWRGWGGIRDEIAGSWLWLLFSTGMGMVTALAGVVLIGIADAIYCLICPECGGLL